MPAAFVGGVPQTLEFRRHRQNRPLGHQNVRTVSPVLSEANHP